MYIEMFRAPSLPLRRALQAQATMSAEQPNKKDPRVPHQFAAPPPSSTKHPPALAASRWMGARLAVCSLRTRLRLQCGRGVRVLQQQLLQPFQVPRTEQLRKLIVRGT
jgi:hypothetical protein